MIPLGVHAGGVAHGGIGAGGAVAQPQVEDAGLTDQRDGGVEDVVAHVVLLQVAHDTGRGVQAEGGAAGEDEGVEGIGVGQGREQAGLPGGGAAAADVDAAGVGAVEEDNGDAGHGLFVLGVAEADALDVGDGDMVHRGDSFDYDVFLIIHTLFPSPQTIAFRWKIGYDMGKNTRRCLTMKVTLNPDPEVVAPRPGRAAAHGRVLSLPDCPDRGEQMYLPGISGADGRPQL